MELVL